MAYTIHITKKEFWASPEGEIINFDEWNSIVDEFKLKPLDQYRALFDNFYLNYSDIEIQSVGPNPNLKIPDEVWIGKMKKIAEKLGANVQGDDGEKY